MLEIKARSENWRKLYFLRFIDEILEFITSKFCPKKKKKKMQPQKFLLFRNEKPLIVVFGLKR